MIWNFNLMKFIKKAHLEYHIMISCDTSSLKIGDGYCDDDLNTRDCDFDGSDCCLKNIESYVRCEKCICWRDYNPHKKNVTIIKEYMEQPWEMCLTFNGTIQCRTKAAVFYGGKSGKLFAYKSIDFDDNSTAILKCTDPLYQIESKTPRAVGMAFVREQGEIYITGGLAEIYNTWSDSLETNTIGNFK